ncbi:exo-alpha-sialidase [bacterium]|nr:exo-alpha-sialidase [bacterium]
MNQNLASIHFIASNVTPLRLPRQTDVFVSGQDGYQTYRIPSVIVTSKGTVLAFCEGRKNSSSDAGDIDIVLKRSFDRGKTWEPMQIIWDDGSNTCGNPCPVIDHDTGTIWLLLTHNLGEDREGKIWDGTSKGTRTVWVMNSTDDGETWSKPVDITKTAKAPNWSWYATGPGVGIQLSHGLHKSRLVVPCDHGIAGSRDYHAHVIYSDDHGATWKCGGSVPDKTTSECQVVELMDGTLMLNIRNHFRETYRRTIAFSKDGGLTWSDVKLDPILTDPHCQASLIGYTDKQTDKKNWLLFSNPASTTRRRMTVRLSYDEGETWSASKLLHPGPSGYSCLTVLPDKTIGCFYERGDRNPYEKITLAQFTLDWLTKPPADVPPRGYSIPTIDLSKETHRQVIIEKKPEQYLGHPTTVLLADGKTILCTYPLGHGGPAAVLKKSIDGGFTWSDRLPVPDNWATATNCPCLHRLTGPDGIERLFVLEGNGAMRQAMSLDNGETWTPFEPNGLHGTVAPNTIVPISGNRYLAHYALEHDGPKNIKIWQSISADGGLTWESERMVAEVERAAPDEPGTILSPDSKLKNPDLSGQILSLLRENSRRFNSLMIVSDDEGEIWSEPTELPGALTGDRHILRYAHDGRLVVTFRDMAHISPTRGDFVAWVGTYEDIIEGREGQYRVRLLQHHGAFGDCGYAGLELLPDGTFIATTYVVHKPGEKNSVISVRFKLEELDAKAK